MWHTRGLGQNGSRQCGVRAGLSFGFHPGRRAIAIAFAATSSLLRRFLLTSCTLSRRHCCTSCSANHVAREHQHRPPTAEPLFPFGARDPSAVNGQPSYARLAPRVPQTSLTLTRPPFLSILSSSPISSPASRLSGSASALYAAVDATSLRAFGARRPAVQAAAGRDVDAHAVCLMIFGLVETSGGP